MLARLARSGGSPKAIVAELGAGALGENDLGPIVDQVLAASPDEVARYKSGKTNLIGFFVGKVMKASRGNANAQLAQRLLEARLA